MNENESVESVEQKESEDQKAKQYKYIQALNLIQSDIKILFLMPLELVKQYKDALTKRMAMTGLKVLITYPDDPETQKIWDKTLKFRLGVNMEGNNEGKREGTNQNQKGLFDVEGMPEWMRLKVMQRENGLITDVEKRFQTIRAEVFKLESERIFWTLVKRLEENWRGHLDIQVKRKQIRELDKEITEYEKPYFTALSYILVEGVSRLTGVMTLEDIMKRYVNLLIIDDLGDRTIESLMDRGFRRHMLSVMSSNALNKKWEEWRDQTQQRNAREKDIIPLTQEIFLANHRDLKDYDLILINNWQNQEGTYPIKIYIKQTKMLSRKEQRLAEKDPQVVAALRREYIAKLEEKEVRLKEILQHINKYENKGGVEEGEYQSLIRRYKQMKKEMQRTEERLKELDRNLNTELPRIMYTRDLIEAMRSTKGKKDKLDDSFLNFDNIKEFMSQHLMPLRQKEVPRIDQMIDLSKKRYQLMQAISKIESTMDGNLSKMGKYAQAQGLCEHDNFDQFIEMHTINKLELAVLSSIVERFNSRTTIYQGSYFWVEGLADPNEWDEQYLNIIKIYIASKARVVPTKTLQEYFGIADEEVKNRIKVSTFLPDLQNFQNDDFQLLIIEYMSFAPRDIANCIAKRNISINHHVPVIIWSNRRARMGLREKLELEHVIGLIPNPDETIGTQVVPYMVLSLDEQGKLPEMLHELLGDPR